MMGLAIVAALALTGFVSTELPMWLAYERECTAEFAEQCERVAAEPRPALGRYAEEWQRACDESRCPPPPPTPRSIRD